MSIRLLPRVDADTSTGQLSLAQRWKLTLALLAASAGRIARRRPAAPTPHEPLRNELQHRALWQAIEQPAGPLAERVWQLAQAHQSPWLLNHSLRSYAWAQALGVIGDLRPDGPCLFAAAMLHDAGLTDAAATPPHHCFAVRGARYAAQTLAGIGEDGMAQRVADAIARHIDLQVDVADGVEAHLLQAGASVDVLGRGLGRLPQAFNDHVLERHPRLQLKDRLCSCLQREASAAPRTRMGWYVRRIDFTALIRRAPFEE